MFRHNKPILPMITVWAIEKKVWVCGWRVSTNLLFGQMINEGKNADLLIASTYEEDSGLFTCRVTNSAGQAETSAKLIVKSKM